MSYDPYQLRSVHDEAATRLHTWYNSHMQQEQEVTKNTEPDVIKVGPEGYEHGWIKVGSPEHKAFNKLNATSQRHVAMHLDAASDAKIAGDHVEASDRLDDAADSVAVGGGNKKLVNHLRGLSRVEGTAAQAETNAYLVSRYGTSDVNQVGTM